MPGTQTNPSARHLSAFAHSERGALGCSYQGMYRSLSQSGSCSQPQPVKAPDKDPEMTEHVYSVSEIVRLVVGRCGWDACTSLLGSEGLTEGELLTALGMRGG